MAELRSKIFIGSSTDGYSIAEKVKVHLSAVGDCFLWHEPNVWEPNKSTFDNLLRMASYYDFGIFVATKDDIRTTKEGFTVIDKPRDNVILEMALFLGSMGRHKSFLLVEEGVTLPTDFDGIFMPRFLRSNDDSIKNACQAYRNKIEEYYKFGYLSLYPTTALAIGYYKNFIVDIVNYLQTTPSIEFKDVSYSDIIVNVIVPADLKSQIRENADVYYKNNGFDKIEVPNFFRGKPLWIKVDPLEPSRVLMCDMPSTLVALGDAIEMFLNNGFMGRTKLQEIIEQRELNNFKRVLQMQIDRSPFAQRSVKIVDEIVLK